MAKLTIEALQTDSFYRQIVETAREGIWILDASLRTTFVNPRLASMLGYASEKMIGVPLDAFVSDPRQRAALYMHLGRGRAGTTEHFDMPLTRSDGSSIWALIESRPFQHRDGDFDGVRVSVIDISPRRAAEERLRQSEAQLLQAQRAARIASWEWDLASDRVKASSAVSSFVGEPRDAAKTIHEALSMVATADRARVEAALQRAVETDAPFDLEYHLLTPGGNEQVVHSHAQRVLGVDGKPVRVIGITQDITDRRRLEDRLRQAERISGLGRLAASVAHEFNNVLMGIQPFADLLARHSQDETVKNAASRMADAVARGKRITQQILRFTRTAEPASVTIEVADWMRGFQQELTQLAGHDVELRMEIDPSLKISGDPHQLRQVFTNLVVNARDAMPGGGLLTITAAADADHAHFTVRDTGSGIPSDTLPFIFEPLFTTKKSGGTGLGLAVAHQVVQRHHGEIWAESDAGKGSSFHIRIPVTDRPAEASIPKPAEVARGVKRITIVEDDENVGAGLVAVLEAMDIDADWIRTGAEAVPRIEQWLPDVVVLDVGLPDIDGPTVFRRIAERWPSLPVIFSTGHGDEGLLAELLDRPNVAYLQKPYDLETLLGKVEELHRRAPANLAAR